jgi:hypothetical protein
MKHVDRKELYTSLPKRLQYLQSFIEWGQGTFPRHSSLRHLARARDITANLPSADVDALQGVQKIVKSLIPTVCEEIYNKILDNDITAQSFNNQSTKGPNDLDVDDYLQKDSQAIRNHRMVRIATKNYDPRILIRPFTSLSDGILPS